MYTNPVVSVRDPAWRFELRFRSAIDSVGSTFPGRSFTRDMVGPLPLNSELYLR